MNNRILGYEDSEELVRLQTRKLIEKADEAEQGNRAKNVLLARLGQELRGPIEILANSCARLLDGLTGELPPQLREQLHLVSRSAHQLAKRVARLLDVSSIETNTLEICATPVDLRLVLQEEYEAMQAKAEARGSSRAPCSSRCRTPASASRRSARRRCSVPSSLRPTTGNSCARAWDWGSRSVAPSSTR
jgi:signal transduction histidine kinase